MQNRQTLLLVVCALLLGINIGLLLGGKSGAQLNVASSAMAESPLMSPRGDHIYTSSADGTKLYEWRPKSHGTNTPNPWIATEHVK